MKKLVLNIVAVALTVLGLGAVATANPAYAAFLCADGKTTAATLNACPEYANVHNKDVTLTTTLNTVINVILGVVGFIAVFMIILGGINFITSQGDTAKTTKARNTILYGVIGLVIALLAFAIVNFVLSNVFGS